MFCYQKVQVHIILHFKSVNENNQRYNTLDVLRSWVDLSASTSPPELTAGSGGAGGAGTEVASVWTVLSEGTRNKLGSAAWERRCTWPPTLSNTLPDEADRRGVQLSLKRHTQIATISLQSVAKKYAPNILLIRYYVFAGWLHAHVKFRFRMITEKNAKDIGGTLFCHTLYSDVNNTRAHTHALFCNNFWENTDDPISEMDSALLQFLSPSF